VICMGEENEIILPPEAQSELSNGKGEEETE
jgi:hypothetical protein